MELAVAVGKIESHQLYAHANRRQHATDMVLYHRLRNDGLWPS